MNADLLPPLYPRRSVVRWGECGVKPLRDLESWTRGGTFHRYGVRGLDRGPSLEEALQRMREDPGHLKITGELLDYRHHIEYWISVRQAGDAESHGHGGPHMTPEDAAYAMLTMIEEHEREVYETNLVMGLA